MLAFPGWVGGGVGGGGGGGTFAGASRLRCVVLGSSLPSFPVCGSLPIDIISVQGLLGWASPWGFPASCHPLSVWPFALAPLALFHFLGHVVCFSSLAPRLLGSVILVPLVFFLGWYGSLFTPPLFFHFFACVLPFSPSYAWHVRSTSAGCVTIQSVSLLQVERLMRLYFFCNQLFSSRIFFPIIMSKANLLWLFGTAHSGVPQLHVHLAPIPNSIILRNCFALRFVRGRAVIWRK